MINQCVRCGFVKDKCPNCGFESKLFLNISVPLEEWDWKDITAHFERYDVVSITCEDGKVVFTKKRHENISKLA